MKDKKKLLFITSNDDVPWGGSEELWYKTALHAIKIGHQVAICCKWQPLPNKLEVLTNYPNCKIIIKERSKSILLNTLNRFLPSRYHLKEISEKYLDEIINWQSDCLIISQGNNYDGLNLMQFSKQHHIPYFTISQAVYEGIWPNTVKAEEMLMAFNNALNNYFVSKANLNTTVLQVGANIKHAKVVFNPFNVAYHTEIPYPNSSKTLKLACVARFEFYAKGQDIILQTLSLDKWRNRNIEVHFFGNGENKLGIEKLIKHFNLQNAFIEPFTETTEIWKNHHALLLTSRFEGLPLALVEAMICGRFGIVTNVSGNKEVIIDDVTGFIAEAPQLEYVDMALERAWAQRENWELIGQKAKIEIKKLVPENPEIELYNDILNWL